MQLKAIAIEQRLGDAFYITTTKSNAEAALSKNRELEKLVVMCLLGSYVNLKRLTGKNVLNFFRVKGNGRYQRSQHPKR